MIEQPYNLQFSYLLMFYLRLVVCFFNIFILLYIPVPQTSYNNDKDQQIYMNIASLFRIKYFSQIRTNKFQINKTNKNIISQIHWSFCFILNIAIFNKSEIFLFFFFINIWMKHTHILLFSYMMIFFLFKTTKKYYLGISVNHFFLSIIKRFSQIRNNQF